MENIFKENKNLKYIYKHFSYRIRKIEINYKGEIITKFFVMDSICDKVDKIRMVKALGKEDYDGLISNKEVFYLFRLLFFSYYLPMLITLLIIF